RRLITRSRAGAGAVRPELCARAEAERDDEADEGDETEAPHRCPTPASGHGRPPVVAAAPRFQWVRKSTFVGSTSLRATRSGKRFASALRMTWGGSSPACTSFTA